jgi:hypothetical protein
LPIRTKTKMRTVSKIAKQEPVGAGIIVSTVQSAVETIPRDMDVRKVLSIIRTGGKRVGPQVEKIRQRFADALDNGDLKRAKQEVDPLKKKLPAVTWSGRFSKRANDKLIEHSGLLCADLDSLNGDLPLVRERLQSSPHVWALFLSPSGDGLKAVFRVPADHKQHPGSFRAVEAHVHDLAGVRVDQACKDVARLCFFSFDRDIYHNEKATEIEPLPEPEKSKVTFSRNSAAPDLNVRQKIVTELLNDIQWQSETTGYCVCPGNEKHTTGNGRRDCRVTLNNAPTIHCVHNSCASVIETYNYRLRSLIGKAEYNGGFPASTSTSFGNSPSKTEKLVDVDVPSNQENTVDELLPPPAPYVPPPLTLLPEVLEDYVHAAAETINVDTSFILLPQLSAVSSGIGNSRSIYLKRGFIQPPVIWTAIIGRSGARKSPSEEAACSPVLDHELALDRQNREAAEIYAEELAAWESKQRKGRGQKPAPPASLTCLMDDMTLEALADALQANPRGVLVKKDELSHWIASFDQYRTGRGADVSRWLSLHTGVFFGVDRRTDKRRYRLHHPRVCITGGIQPKILRRVLTEDFFDRGLPARFLFAAPPARQDKWNENTVADKIERAVSALFEELWLLQPERDGDIQRPVLLKLDADAKEQYVAYYNATGAAALEGDEREEAAWSKLSGYAARLALVGQLARDPNAKTVTGEVMAAACDLARWCGNEAIRIYATFSETQEQRNQRKLIEFIQSRGGSVTVREVMQYYRPLRDNREEAERALNALFKTGRGEWVEIRTGKRGPATRKFRYLQVSTSTSFPETPRIAPKLVDVDTHSPRDFTPSEETDEGAMVL